VGQPEPVADRPLLTRVWEGAKRAFGGATAGAFGGDIPDGGIGMTGMVVGALASEVPRKGMAAFRTVGSVLSAAVGSGSWADVAMNATDFMPGKRIGEVAFGIVGKFRKAERVPAPEAVLRTMDQVELYVDSEAAKSTVEVLWMPGRFPKQVTGTGHLAMRIDDELLDMHEHVGTARVIPFTDHMRERLVGRGEYIEGYAFPADDVAKRRAREFFEDARDRNSPYNILFNNCSENVCRSLEASDLADIQRALRVDPAMASARIKHLPEMQHQVVYNLRDVEPRHLTGANVAFRTVAVGIVAGAATGAVMAVDAADLFENSEEDPEHDGDTEGVASPE